MPAIVNWLSHWETEAPGRCALRGGGTEYSYAELGRLTRVAAHELADHGLRAFDLVALDFPRTARAAAAMLSLSRASVAGIVLDWRAPARELAPLAHELGVRALLTHESKVPAYLAAHREAELLPLRSWPQSGYALLFWRKAAPHPGLARENIRWALLTSGSTGRPKAVLISGKNLEERTEGEVELFGLTPGERILNCLSFAHDLGLNQLLTSVRTGSTLRMILPLSPVELVSQMRAEDFSGMTGTPVVWRNFFLAVDAGIDIGGIRPRYVTVSGGSLTPGELDRLRALLPATRVIRTYGQTETFRTLASASDAGASLGRPVRGCGPGSCAKMATRRARGKPASYCTPARAP